jgi:hypothetical protein
MPKSKSVKKFLIQQGDVCAFGGEQIPADAKPMKIQNGGYVLANGETTGHQHVVTADPAKVEGFEKDGVIYLAVKAAKVTVKHQEHKPITLKKGNYKVGIVQTVDPLSGEVRKVQD